MSTEAWLLHKTPSGDTSTRLHLFTREKGLVSCLYKGGRTPKKQAILQAFIPLWLSLDTNKDWYYVRNLETVSVALDLKGIALFAALYINELVYYALKPLDPYPELYDAYHYTLRALASVTERLAMEALLRKFEWALLCECGYMLSFDDCESGRAVCGNQRYRFVVGKGFTAAADGLSGAHILAISQGQFIDVAVLKTAKLIMRQAINHFLGGRELQSRRLFKPQ